jgi:transposase
MTTNTKSRAEMRTHALSSDLSRCVGERGLLKLALDAVLTLEPERLREARRRSPDFSPQMMLTLLTYCYSASLYGSRDIEWAIERDRTVRYICARVFPDWQSLRRFRRQHRELLRQCLVYVMKQTWALKFDEGEADYVGYEWFESELIELVNRAAADRLDFAALMDGAESE